MENIWQKINKPILMLSPMAGYTDSAFRMLCKEQGATLLMTELISADAIYHFAKKSEARNTNDETKLKSQIKKFKDNPTYKLMDFSEKEMPIIVQLFGKRPEKFAAAVKWIEENMRPAGIDINMGCPAKKVVKSDHGATLLRDQDRGVEVVKAARASTKLPLSVKTRLGWESDDEILEFVPKLIDAGVDALIIHGRTYKDGFSGTARWENIYKIKSEIQNSNDEVKIIGNGDIKNQKDIKERLDNLDGVAVGRGAIGNPFIFNNQFENLSEEEKLEAKKTLALRHGELSYELKGEKGIIELRKHLLLYFRGHERAKELRKKFVEVKNLEQVREVLSLV